MIRFDSDRPTAMENGWAHHFPWANGRWYHAGASMGAGKVAGSTVKLGGHCKGVGKVGPCAVVRLWNIYTCNCKKI